MPAEIVIFPTLIKEARRIVRAPVGAYSECEVLAAAETLMAGDWLDHCEGMAVMDAIARHGLREMNAADDNAPSAWLPALFAAAVGAWAGIAAAILWPPF